MKFKLEPYNRNTKDIDLLKDLKEVAIKLNKASITTKEYDLLGKFHSCTIIRRFDKWNRALENANLGINKNHGISNEELFKNIEEVWIKLGRQPYYSDIKGSKYGSKTYNNRFGTWRNALEQFVNFINTEENYQTTDRVVLKEKNTSYDASIYKHKTKRDINWRLRFLVMRKDNFKCKICGKSPATNPATVLHVDHKIPYSKNGETVIENLQTLCSICNIGKSDLSLDQLNQ